MTSVQHREVDEALARAAEQHGVAADPEKLRLIVYTAFAPHETMTAGEREFLVEAGLPADSFDPHTQALARARLAARAEATRAEAAPRLPTSKVAAMLGRDAANVRRSAGNGDLYAIASAPGREREFPAWQFVDGRPLRGLREVIASLPERMHPLSVEGFMTAPQDELDGRTPVEWLATGGDVSAVVELAETEAHA